MYVLIGQTETVEQHWIAGPFESFYTIENIALFTSRKKAESYITKAKLKNAKRQAFVGDVYYRANSLLNGCCDAWVEKHYPEELPVDPNI